MSLSEKSAEKKILGELVPLKVEGQYLGLITFNRPKDLNPLDWDTVLEIIPVFRELAGNKNVRVIAFIGSGRAFSAGGDMKKYQTLQRQEVEFMQFLDDFAQMIQLMQTARQPVVALVNGWCVAGGIELMLGCDFAYASESAKIGDGHTNFGMIGGGGSQVRLPRRIPFGQAFEIIYTGKFLNASEALECGLVNRVVPDEVLIDAALEFANSVAEKSPLGIAKLKYLMYTCLNRQEDDAAKIERQVVHHYCLTSFDAREGLNAFCEKRKPKFEGR